MLIPSFMFIYVFLFSFGFCYPLFMSVLSNYLRHDYLYYDLLLIFLSLAIADQYVRRNKEFEFEVCQNPMWQTKTSVC